MLCRSVGGKGCLILLLMLLEDTLRLTGLLMETADLTERRVGEEGPAAVDDEDCSGMASCGSSCRLVKLDSR